MALLEKYNNGWISKEEIEVLNHNLNFSNWTETYACKGKWKIEISDKGNPAEKINIYMPTSEWGKPHSGYWQLYSGRMEIKEKELLIWQNEKVSVRLNYSEDDSTIGLVIYGRLITFERDK